MLKELAKEDLKTNFHSHKPLNLCKTSWAVPGQNSTFVRSELAQRPYQI